MATTETAKCCAFFRNKDGWTIQSNEANASRLLARQKSQGISRATLPGSMETLAAIASSPNLKNLTCACDDCDALRDALRHAVRSKLHFGSCITHLIGTIRTPNLVPSSHLWETVEPNSLDVVIFEAWHSEASVLHVDTSWQKIKFYCVI